MKRLFISIIIMLLTASFAFARQEDESYYKFNFNEALKEKNEATGIMIFGIFMGIAFLVSGVIQ